MMKILFTSLIITLCISLNAQNPFEVEGVNDTITTRIVFVNGEAMTYKALQDVYLNNWSVFVNNSPEWTRLRNAVYVTYPYAKRAGQIMNEINALISPLADKKERKKIIKSRESDLKREFTKPLSNLSVYQGKVLMKLINRQTGNNCFEIIKEFRGGFQASAYQAVAFVFGSNLKQAYDPTAKDSGLESIVLDVEKMYGYR